MIATRVGLWVVTIVAFFSALALISSLIDTAWASVIGSSVVLLLCLSGIRNLRGRVARLSA